MKIDVWMGLCRLSSVSGTLECDFLARLGARCAKLRPRWQQVVPKMRHDGVKMAILGPTWMDLGPSWSQLGRFGQDLGSILEPCWHMGGIVKPYVLLRFLIDFRDSGLLDGVVWTSWRLCWRMLGPRCAQDGSKMNDFRPSWGTWRSWRQDGSKTRPERSSTEEGGNLG